MVLQSLSFAAVWATGCAASRHRPTGTGERHVEGCSSVHVISQSLPHTDQCTDRGSGGVRVSVCHVGRDRCTALSKILTDSVS